MIKYGEWYKLFWIAFFPCPSPSISLRDACWDWTQDGSENFKSEIFFVVHIIMSVKYEKFNREEDLEIGKIFQCRSLFRRAFLCWLDHSQNVEFLSFLLLHDEQLKTKFACISSNSFSSSIMGDLLFFMTMSQTCWIDKICINQSSCVLNCWCNLKSLLLEQYSGSTQKKHLDISMEQHNIVVFILAHLW